MICLRHGGWLVRYDQQGKWHPAAICELCDGTGNDGTTDDEGGAGEDGCDTDGKRGDK